MKSTMKVPSKINLGVGISSTILYLIFSHGFPKFGYFRIDLRYFLSMHTHIGVQETSSTATKWVQKLLVVTYQYISIISLTHPLCRTFFSRGRWVSFNSLREETFRLWTMPTRYRSSTCLPSHFRSGKRMNPVAGSESSNTILSVSFLCSRMLWTH